MHRSTVHRTIQLAATLAVATTIAPRPAATQPAPDYFCSAIDPEVEVCVGEGDDQICAWRHRSCEFDFDNDEDFERTAHFFELRGSASAPPFILAGDRHCYQGEDFDPIATEPDAEDYGYNTFALLLPADYQSGSFPVYLDLRGALAGWVSQSGVALSAWALDVSVDPFEWEKGLYRGALFFAQGSFNDQNIMNRLLDTGPLRVMLRAKTDPSWGFLVPSACSHDGYNGRLDIPGSFPEAEQTRFGFVSIAEALQLIEEVYGIDYLYSGATSGGGMGSYIFARFLPEDLAFLSEPNKYRGAMVAAAPVEFQNTADLYDPAQTIWVSDDNDCQDQDEAEVPCAHPAEPLESSFMESGLIAYSASEDILNQEINVPLLHSWNKRGNEHCYDYCYSEANIHGPIRDEIETRKLDGEDIPFRFSENVQMCVGSCKGLNNVIIDCTAHGVIEDAGDCAEDWIDAINGYWDEDIPYGTPASCQNIPAQGTSTNPPECKPQNQGIDM